MGKTMPEWLKVGMLLGLMLVAGWLTAAKKLLINQNPVSMATPTTNPKTTQQKIKIGSTELLVELRRTVAEQGLGLSWRPSMNQDEGMVFLYATPQKVMYWMKGMQFPLDFIWAKQGEVTEMTLRVVSPTKEQPIPKTLVPKGEVDMVIEVNAGWVEANGVKVGDKITF